MVVCDEVVRDRATGKASIIGVFRTIVCKAFPCVHPSLAVWFELTSGHGEVPLALRISRTLPDDLNGESIFEARWSVTFGTPLTVIDSSLKLIGIEMPAPGEYLIRLESEGLLLASRSLEVVLQEE